MTDYKRLKHLALAQPVKEWRSEEGEPSMMTGERMYYVIGPGGVSCWEHGAHDRVSASYIAAASPAVVLGLIAENERLTNRLEVDPRHDYDGISTRDATVKVLDEQVDQLKAENERLEVEVKRMTSIAYAAHGAFRMETMAERDQLRAEVAGLRTGYEAYERVNAELKAEVEALRKLGPSKEIIWCACGDGYPVNSYGAGFMAANGDVCENCDAANGRVEPHLDTPDELKALRQALTDIFNHVEGNTECLVRDLVNWGTPRINPNDFYDECEAIKEIANAALGQGEQS